MDTKTTPAVPTPARKKAYTPPTVTEHGNVEQLTRGPGTLGVDALDEVGSQ